MFFRHRHDYTSWEMPWPFNSDFGPNLNRSESRWLPDGLKSDGQARSFGGGSMSGSPECGKWWDDFMSARASLCASSLRNAFIAASRVGSYPRAARPLASPADRLTSGP